MILVFTILCAIVLMVFSVELILQNRNTEASDEGGEPSVSGDKQPGDGGDSGADPEHGGSEPSGTEDGDSGGDDAGDGGGRQPDRPRPIPTGTRFEEPITLNSTLVFYADKELFNYTDPEMSDRLGIFTFRGDGIAELHIRLIAVTPDIKALAGGYMSVDFDVIETEVSDEDYIGLSQLLGVKASGYRDGSNFDVWIHRFTEPGYEDLGLAFVIIYQNNALKDLLYDILDTLEIV